MTSKLTSATCAFACASLLAMGAFSAGLGGCAAPAQGAADSQTEALPANSQSRGESESPSPGDAAASAFETPVSSETEGDSSSTPPSSTATSSEAVPAPQPGAVEASVGEWVDAVDGFAVRVDSIEEGPFDQVAGTPTVMVAVTIRNQAQHAQGANTGFWSAENTDGATVTNKSGLKDADGKAVKMSFNSGCIPPGTVVHGTLYFEGSALASIAYAPHLSGSEEDQRITFRL